MFMRNGEYYRCHRETRKGVLAHSKWKICITIPFRWLSSTYPKRNHSLLVKQSLPLLLDTAAKILSYCSQFIFNFYTLLGKTNAAYLILEQTTIFSQACPLTGSTQPNYHNVHPRKPSPFFRIILLPRK